MKKEIIIPPVGESVREVTVGRFLKKQGEFVEESEEIVELETEKVNQVIYSPLKGTINWQVEEGQTAQVGDVIGYVESGEKKEKVEAPSSKPLSKPLPKAEPKPETKAAPKSVAKSAEEPAPAPKRAQEGVKKTSAKNESRQKMSRIRKTIAGRLVEALHSSAMLTTFNEVDMSAVMGLRAHFKESFLQKHGIKLGMTSFFVQAVFEALKAFPLLNAYIDGDEVVQRHYYDIGVAVSTDRGLVVPVIRDCEKHTFADMEKGVAEFARKAREGKLQIEDLEGGGFTITNGGIFGSLLSTPILNTPQVGILGMHNIVKRPVVIDDQIVIRPMMYVALSYDHRLIDGKEAIQFLIKVKEVLENPSYFNLEA